MATTANVLADRYEVRKKLGEGGMGVVYLAYDRNLKTDVVVKMPLPSAMADPGFVERFTHEIRAMVQLRHPHVVPILDVGTHGKRPFAVMAFLGGGSLLDTGLPAVPSSLPGWLTAIASALDFVHSQGTLHRDVKPANILFDQHGFAFLSDFGVAKVLAEGPSDAVREPLTGKGLVIGTAEYMAPELIRARQDVDGRADQYALAATVYEVLSGRTPFVASEAQAVMVAQVTDPVPPLTGVSPALEAAVMRGLAKERSQRYRTCAEFAQAVLAAAAGSPPANARTSGTARIPSTRLETPAAGQVAKTRIEAPPTDPLDPAPPRTGKRKNASEPVEVPRGGGTGAIAAVAVIAVMVLAAGAFIAFLVTRGRAKPNDNPGGVATAKDDQQDKDGKPAVKEETAFLVTSPGEVRIGAGGTVRTVVKIDRKRYKGPVAFTISDLPPGVTLRPVDVPPGLSEMPLVLDATDNAKQFSQSVKLVGKGLGVERSAEFRLVVEGKPKLTLRTKARSISLPLNQPTRERVALDRDNCRDKSVKLRLDTASRGAFRDILEAEPPTELAGGVDEFHLVFRPTRKPTGPLTLVLEAYLESDPSVTTKLTLECRVTD